MEYSVVRHEPCYFDGLLVHRCILLGQPLQFQFSTLNSCMLLKTKIAVTSVSNLHDARYCAGMGVNWVSFPIVGEQAVSPSDFEEIVGWITGPELLAEVIGNSEADLSSYQFDGLFTDQMALFERFSSDVPCFFQIDIDAKNSDEVEALLAQVHANAKAILLKSEKALADQSADWLSALCQKYSIILSFAFSPEEADKALKLSPLGLGLTGSEEQKVGLNDFEGLADVLEALELED